MNANGIEANKVRWGDEPPVLCCSRLLHSYWTATLSIYMLNSLWLVLQKKIKKAYKNAKKHLCKEEPEWCLPEFCNAGAALG